MWEVLFLFIVLCSTGHTLGPVGLLEKGFGTDRIIGEGRWYLSNVLKCDKPEQYEIQVEIFRRKINRTHDAFSMHVDLDREFNNSYGVLLLIYKEMDGGYKLYLTVLQRSFCNEMKEFSGENFYKLLKSANIDPPDCPIPPGRFEGDDLVIDYRQIITRYLYGNFQVYTYLMYKARRVACFRALAHFEKNREDEDDDDDENV